MSRRRDREKREKRLLSVWWWPLLLPTSPGSRMYCSHDVPDYIAHGYRCPETDSQGVCMAEIPF